VVYYESGELREEIMAYRFVFGAALVIAVGLGAYFLYPSGPGLCQVCQRPLHAETFYQVRLKDGRTETVCCPRCGLRFQEGRDDVAATRVADFASGKLLEARDALYVEGSKQRLCCSPDVARRDPAGGQVVLTWDRCLPSLVAFEKREDAEEFRKREGGVLRTYGATDR